MSNHILMILQKYILLKHSDNGWLRLYDTKYESYFPDVLKYNERMKKYETSVWN